MNDEILIAHKKPLVLIVDDVPENIQVLAGVLSNEYCEIAAATSGEQSLKLIRKSCPDLILLDIMMPGMDGFEVCRKLKDIPETKNIPVIFLTAMTEIDHIVKGFELGAVDYVTKPFNSAEMLSRVRTHLKLKKAMDAEKELIANLKEALAQVKQLSGIIPICSNCKNIRNDDGYWQQVEKYINEHSGAMFTHGICPDCVRKLYPEMADRILKNKEE